jgi:hypothetical protein
VLILIAILVGVVLHRKQAAAATDGAKAAALPPANMLVNNATYTTDPLPEYLEPVAGQNAVYAAAKVPRMTLVGSAGDTYEYGDAGGGGAAANNAGVVYAVPMEEEGGAGAQMYEEPSQTQPGVYDAANSEQVAPPVYAEPNGHYHSNLASVYHNSGEYGDAHMYVEPNPFNAGSGDGEIRLQSHTQGELSEYC